MQRCKVAHWRSERERERETNGFESKWNQLVPFFLYSLGISLLFTLVAIVHCEGGRERGWKDEMTDWLTDSTNQGKQLPQKRWMQMNGHLLRHCSPCECKLTINLHFLLYASCVNRTFVCVTHSERWKGVIHYFFLSLSIVFFLPRLLCASLALHPLSRINSVISSKWNEQNKPLEMKDARPQFCFISSVE